MSQRCQKTHMASAAAARRSYEALMDLFAERSPLYLKRKWKCVCRHKPASLSLINRLNHSRQCSNESRDHSASAGRRTSARFLGFHNFCFGLPELRRASALLFVIPLTCIPHRRCCKSPLYLLSSNRGPLISSCLACSRPPALGLGCSSSSPL